MEVKLVILFVMLLILASSLKLKIVKIIDHLSKNGADDDNTHWFRVMASAWILVPDVAIFSVGLVLEIAASDGSYFFLVAAIVNVALWLEAVWYCDCWIGKALADNNVDYLLLSMECQSKPKGLRWEEKAVKRIIPILVSFSFLVVAIMWVAHSGVAD